MISPIQTAILPLPPVHRSEVLRYAGAREETPEIAALLDGVLEEAGAAFCGRVCWREFPVTCCNDELDLGFARTSSTALQLHLSGCDRVLIFAATVGLEIDRLILRRGKTDPARALMLQALGTERIEALCDAFQELAAGERPATSRFSPGYGDLPLEFQQELFRVLDCSRTIGLSLNESLIMSPSKSVTAILGIGASRCAEHNCARCGKTDCIYRRLP